MKSISMRREWLLKLLDRGTFKLEDMFYATLQVIFTPITGFLSPRMIDSMNYYELLTHSKLMLRQSFLVYRT